MAQRSNVDDSRSGDLDLRLDSRTLTWLLWASLFPLVVLLCLGTRLYVDVEHNSLLESPSTTWQQVDIIAYSAFTFGLPLSVAVLVFIGVRSLDRRVGSWALVITGILLVLSVGFGMSSVVIYATHTPQQNTFDGAPDTLTKLRPQTWVQFSDAFGFLAIGYAFLAYRGLNIAQRTGPRRQRLARRRVRIPPSQRREL